MKITKEPIADKKRTKKLPAPNIEMQETLPPRKLQELMQNVIITSAAIAAIVAFGYGVGIVVNQNKFDKEKADLAILNNDLKDTIRRLQLQTTNTEMNQENWQLQHSNNIVFNTDTHLPTLSLTTTTLPCLSGKPNGCWTVTTDIFKGDTLSVSIYVENDSKFPVADVKCALGYLENYDKHSILFEAKIASGDFVILEGAAVAFYSITSKYTIKFLPKITKVYYHGASMRFVDGGDFFKNGYEIGVLQPHQEQVIILNFSVLTKG